MIDLYIRYFLANISRDISLHKCSPLSFAWVLARFALAAKSDLSGRSARFLYRSADIAGACYQPAWISFHHYSPFRREQGGYFICFYHHSYRAHVLVSASEELFITATYDTISRKKGVDIDRGSRASRVVQIASPLRIILISSSPGLFTYRSSRYHGKPECLGHKWISRLFSRRRQGDDRFLSA